MEKKIEEYNIKFHGIKKIKAHTKNEAIATLENMKNIRVDRPVRTESVFYWMIKSIVENIPGFMVMVFSLFIVFFWLIVYISIIEIDDPLGTIAKIIFLMFMIVTFRLPVLVKSWAYS